MGTQTKRQNKKLKKKKEKEKAPAVVAAGSLHVRPLAAAHSRMLAE